MLKTTLEARLFDGEEVPVGYCNIGGHVGWALIEEKMTVKMTVFLHLLFLCCCCSDCTDNPL
jgi:hypothetical protein